ncbi:MAG: hypothetical protein AAB583_05965 [Patescibacteria group bacterium]
MAKKITALFCFWNGLIYIFAYLATFLIPLQIKFTAALDFGLRLPYLVWIWGNFDGTHYMEIARNGYHPSENAFFPLYPLLIKFLYETFRLIGVYLPYLFSSQIISNLAFFLSLFFLYKILQIDHRENLSILIFSIIILFPTSYSYGAAYNDSLFFLLTTLTIYFARKQSFFVSSIMGALATLTRLNGLALIFIILFEYIELNNTANTWGFKTFYKKIKNSLDWRIVSGKKIYAVVLIPLAFAGYLLYTHIFHGKWDLVFSSMQVWNQDTITFPLQVFWRYFKILTFVSPTNIVYFVATIELLSVLFYIFIIIYSYKKIRLSYWIFIIISILIPSLTGTFAGMPRYALHLYPLFLGIALFLEQKSLVFKICYFTVTTVLLFLLLMLFTRGYFVA